MAHPYLPGSSPLRQNKKTVKKKSTQKSAAAKGIPIASQALNIYDVGKFMHQAIAKGYRTRSVTKTTPKAASGALSTIPIVGGIIQRIFNIGQTVSKKIKK